MVIGSRPEGKDGSRGDVSDESVGIERDENTRTPSG